MPGIKAIASCIPETSIDNIAQAQKFGESEVFITDKIGAIRLPRKRTTEDTSDLATQALNRLIDSTDLTREAIDVLVVVTQNGDGEGLPQTSAIVQKKAGLNTAIAAFDISLGCSGFVYGLHILKGFLTSTGLHNGVLITADPYSKIIDPDDKNTSLLFGDAATATWIGPDPVWHLGPTLFGTDGEGETALKTSNHRLSMNGRQVFDFAARQVAPHIRALLEKAMVTEEAIDLFCLHQGSYAIVDAIARRFRGSTDKFIRDIRHTGNTVSSSIPLLLEKHVMHTSHQNIIISGFGVGFSWATALLTRQPDMTDSE